MTIPGFSKEKVYMLLGVLVVMGILWGLQKWFEKRTTISNMTPGSPTSSSLHFKSEQVRKLPCGRFQKQTVELDGPTGIKSIQLLDKDGITVLQEKKMPIDGDHCTAISHGKFVPDLWKDCRL